MAGNLRPIRVVIYFHWFIKVLNHLKFVSVIVFKFLSVLINGNSSNYSVLYRLNLYFKDNISSNCYTDLSLC